MSEYSSRSNSTITIGLGLKTWIVDNVGVYESGMNVRIVFNSFNYIEGTIFVIEGNSVTVRVKNAVGFGTYSRWNFTLAGAIFTFGESGATGATGFRGATGPIGATGIQGPSGDPGGATGPPRLYG